MTITKLKKLSTLEALQIITIRGQKMKLWKCICRKSEFTDKGQILIGNIYSKGEYYFKGASFHATKEGEWEVDGTITLTREDFEKCVQKFSEIC